MKFPEYIPNFWQFRHSTPKNSIYISEIHVAEEKPKIWEWYRFRYIVMSPWRFPFIETERWYRLKETTNVYNMAMWMRRLYGYISIASIWRLFCKIQSIYILLSYDFIQPSTACDQKCHVQSMKKCSKEGMRLTKNVFRVFCTFRVKIVSKWFSIIEINFHISPPTFISIPFAGKHRNYVGITTRWIAYKLLLVATLWKRWTGITCSNESSICLPPRNEVEKNQQKNPSTIEMLKSNLMKWNQIKAWIIFYREHFLLSPTRLVEFIGLDMLFVADFHLKAIFNSLNRLVYFC